MDLPERTEDAVDRFTRMTCSKAMLSAYHDLTGLTEEQSLALATGFRKGLFKRQTCGAVTAMMMIAGLAGMDENGLSGLMDEFEKRMGSTMCDHFTVPHGYGGCPRLVRCASELLNEKVFGK